MPDIIVHMGFSKCASTTIQGYLIKMDRVSGGKFWTGTGKGLPKRHGLSNEIIKAGKLNDQGSFGPQWDRFLKHAKGTTDHETICLSAESYERSDPAAVKQMMDVNFADRGHFAVGYVRPHPAHLWSLFCHQWRIGKSNFTLEEFLRKRSIYKKSEVVRDWKNSFGDNYLIFDLRLATGLANPGMHLAQALRDKGVFAPDAPVTPTKNESLNSKEIAVSAYLCRHHFEGRDFAPRWVLAAHALDVLGKRIDLSGSKPSFPKSKRELLVENAREDAQGLDQLVQTEEGFEAALDAFDPTGDDVSFAIRDQLTDAEIAEVEAVAKQTLDHFKENAEG